MKNDRRIPDPMEEKVAELLELLGLTYIAEADGVVLGDMLDFRVGRVDIEAKQFHSPRAIHQLEKFKNAILFQGVESVQMMIDAVKTIKKRAELDHINATLRLPENARKKLRFKDVTLQAIYEDCRKNGNDIGSIFYFDRARPRAGGSIRSAYWAGRSGSGGDLYKEKTFTAYAAWAAGCDDRKIDLENGNACRAPKIVGNGGKIIFEDWTPTNAAAAVVPAEDATDLVEEIDGVRPVLRSF